MFVTREQKLADVFFGALGLVVVATGTHLLATGVFEPALSTPEATRTMVGVLQALGY